MADNATQSTKKTGEEKGQPTIRIRVQTSRGMWSLTEPADASLRPEYPQSTKVQQVIDDVRQVFQFAENDSSYTLMMGDDMRLDPQRTLVSYHLEDDALLLLTVVGGNA